MNPEIISNILSLGAALVNTQVKDAAGLSDQIASYELFAQGYLGLPAESWFVRPAIRVSYEPAADVERPKAVAITERNFKALIDLGLVCDWYVVPAISLQGGIVRRKIDLTSNSRIGSDSSHSISATEYLWQQGASLGLGLPVLDGAVIIEPHFRVIDLRGDERQKFQWGIDLSYAIR
ncbi:MAG: hypothetical protein EBR09_12180 [Proteobacteria bacterium]|nr:hypothetical protein [Pseudomonadota bacterium]